jgi:hypothetical protein
MNEIILTWLLGDKRVDDVNIAADRCHVVTVGNDGTPWHSPCGWTPPTRAGAMMQI